MILNRPMPAGAQNGAPIERRGWCIFERHMSHLVKMARCTLYLNDMPPLAKVLLLPDPNRGFV